MKRGPKNTAIARCVTSGVRKFSGECITNTTDTYLSPSCASRASYAETGTTVSTTGDTTGAQSAFRSRKTPPKLPSKNGVGEVANSLSRIGNTRLIFSRAQVIEP